MTKLVFKIKTNPYILGISKKLAYLHAKKSHAKANQWKLEVFKNKIEQKITVQPTSVLTRGKYIDWKEETIPRQPFENQKLFPRKLRPSQGDIHKWSNFWGVFEPLPKPSPLKMIWNSQSIEPSCKVWKKSHLNTFFQACGKRFAPAKIRNFSQNLRFC